MKKRTIIFLTLILIVILGGCENSNLNNSGLFNLESTIKVYTRSTSSGTRSGFMSYIDFREAVADNTVLVDKFIETGNSEMIASIKADKYAIGYTSMASRDDEQFKTFNFDSVEATEENVLNGYYSMSRNFNYMLRDSYDINKDNSLDEKEIKIRDIALAWQAYISTRTGKVTIFDADGIVDVSTGDKWETIAGNYPVCSADNSDLTIKFGGSDSVQDIAEELSASFRIKCGNFKVEHNHQGSSTAYQGLNGSSSSSADPAHMHIGFSSREFKDNEKGDLLKRGVIAKDAIIVFGNLSNPNNNLTSRQIKDIYSGQVTKWSDT